MGLVTEIVKSSVKTAVKSVAIDGAIKVLDGPVKALAKADEIKVQKKEDKLFQRKPGTEILIIDKPDFGRREKFDVYDESRTVKYTVKDELISIKHSFHIYNIKGKKVGTVKGKSVSRRSHSSSESIPVDIIIEANGKKLGKIKSKDSFIGNKYNVDYNNWRIEGNIFGLKYKILEEDNEIANISEKVFTFGKTYIVTFPNPQNETIILLLVMAIYVADAIRQSKANTICSEQNEGGTYEYNI